ncbi:hypothetical protein E5161_15190 [Cohnella pontilimi]|uniref:DUF2564 family protein n=1 Tax=Cohnella pontilimi TaxID=2564100 RepID=A0A4V5LS70_9BACL|nr:hypothetical protein [Cohnella pontilimi]TJY41049.1 hypothetical protein E5161_15190 [Cohnella pontilimi]
MSEQNKTTQAENAIGALQHAVDQAESHPSDNKIEEAEQAFRHAEIAVRQAKSSDSNEADELDHELHKQSAQLNDSNQ